MREGDVVMVVGMLDNRIRDSEQNEPIYGTIVSLSNQDVIVLLSDGNLYRGQTRDIVKERANDIT